MLYMKSFSKFFTVALVVGLSVLLFYTFYILYLKSSRLISCIEELSSYKLIESRWKEDFNKSLHSNGSILPEINVIDQNNRKIELKNIIKDNTLVYRFSEVSCRPCVEDDIKILNELKDSIIGNNLFILTDFKTPKEMQIFSKMYNLKVPIYSYPNCINLLADMDTFDRKPYYFVLDTDLKVHFTYISHSGHNMHDKYFLRIIEYIQENDINKRNSKERICTKAREHTSMPGT